jgi:hypothetical protein
MQKLESLERDAVLADMLSGLDRRRRLIVWDCEAAGTLEAIEPLPD